jgi:hypothetical protein
MFSMKPKFDLAKFLSEPAPAGASRQRGRRGMKFAPAAASEDTAKPAVTEDKGSTE